MINFDNAATTDSLGNPASPHALGVRAERTVIAATEKLADIIGCRPGEIIYTSGCTESNNLALLGAAEALSKRGGMILTTPYEHPSVLGPIGYIKSKGVLDVIEAPVAEWEHFLCDGCVLASCTHVNHETGEINDINKIAGLIKSINRKIIFHVDGAQGFCKAAMPLGNIDLYSFSAHKFFGPPGVGGLIVRRGTPAKPIMFGGRQQNALRPGTLNVPGILNMIEAAETAWNERDVLYGQAVKVKSIIMSIAGELPNVFINADAPDVSPFILNMSFMGIKGETLVHMLSGKGIYVSMGAACRSGKKDVSPLEKMGYGKEQAESAIRFSFSRNTMAEAEIAKAEIIKCITELRSVKQNRK